MSKEIFVPTERIKDKGKIEREMARIIIHCDAGEVSDGYHTFNELYEHRYLLFCAFARSWSYYIWKSRNHWMEYGKLEPVWPGWFLAGLEMADGRMITYHLPIEYWDLFAGEERETPPIHDGHTSQDVIERLKEWLKS
jgi:hypothetical protein